MLLRVLIDLLEQATAHGAVDLIGGTEESLDGTAEHESNRARDSRLVHDFEGNDPTQHLRAPLGWRHHAAEFDGEQNRVK